MIVAKAVAELTDYGNTKDYADSGAKRWLWYMVQALVMVYGVWCRR
jgi:hypothetical protein